MSRGEGPRLYARATLWVAVLALAGCEWLAAPITRPVAGSPAPVVHRLSPQELILNLPAEGSAPPAYESSGSFRIEGEMPSDHAMAWSIADASVATISSTGVITALATGSTLVTLEAAWLVSPATASVHVLDRGRAAVTIE